MARAYRPPSVPSKKTPQISNHSPSESSTAQIGGQGRAGSALDPGERDPPCRLLPHQNAKEQSQGNAVVLLIGSSNDGETVFPPRRPFPGCDYRLSGLARAGLWFRASGGRTRDASKKKKGGTRPPPVVPGSRLRQVSFCRLRHEPRVDREAIVDRVEKILPVQPHIGPETLVRLD